ncbi:MAG: hypothetical protein JXQ73_19400, partial [Phycisphaerae bacterium]|nr:hypothetical protein [Phycisphaerae bacterium]
NALGCAEMRCFEGSCLGLEVVDLAECTEMQHFSGWSGMRFRLGGILQDNMMHCHLSCLRKLS